jgi:protein-S-isoprenylcysteine O-methyltransferase Ste14
MSESGIETASDNDGLKIYPPALAGTLLLCGLLLHLLVGHGHRLVHFHQLLGLLVIAVGVGLSSYAAALFTARDTTKNPYGQPTVFVAVMPYTLTRNPMYLGLTAVLLGFGLFFGSIAMLLAPAAFLIVIDRTVIAREEATLERLFGEQYLDYKSRVRRWL